MHMENKSDTPAILRGFLNYLISIGDKSPKTVDEYFLDLRLFLRYMKYHFGMFKPENGRALTAKDLENISISDIDIDFIKRIKLTDVYEFFNYLSRNREKNQNSVVTGFGLAAASRARKASSIRAFFKYLNKRANLLEVNPVEDLELPKRKRTLVKYLSVDESMQLLSSISGINQSRDYCIITLFLNCGLRVSELVGINLKDFNEDMLRIVGKGGKERVVYLNDACLEAVSIYRSEREKLKDIEPTDQNAFFVSRKRRRISASTVKWLVKKYCEHAGLDSKISVHKLRHTSATLMYRSGVDVKVLQEILGHKHLNTTEIYTHVDNEDMRTAARANPLSKVRRYKDTCEDDE